MSPAASSAATRRTMQANRRRDTGPEIALRKALFAAGLRYRVDYPIRVDGGRPIRADIAFTRARVAIFVDGCFWHRCPEHGTMPKANRAYWEPKLARNVERDREVDRRLADAGWTIMRFWEHEDTYLASVKVRDALARVGRSRRSADVQSGLGVTNISLIGSPR